MFVISSCQTKATSCCFPSKTSSASDTLCLYTAHHLCVSAVVDNKYFFLFCHGTMLRKKRKKSTVPYQKSYQNKIH